MQHTIIFTTAYKDKKEFSTDVLHQLIPYSTKFSRVLILRLSRIVNCLQKYLNKRSLICSVQCAHTQWIHEIILKKIAIRKKFRPSKT